LAVTDRIVHYISVW